MANFSTDLIIPDKQEGASGFFRVVGPVLTWVILAGFIKSYYVANGYPPPFFLANGLLTFITIFLTILMFLLWYHKRFDKRGTLTIEPDKFHFTWDDSDRVYDLNPKELKDLTLVYDGYAGVLSPFKGTQNSFSFTYNGEPHKINFYLNSQEDALQMAEALRSWYKNGVNLKEYNTKGKERYLMLYSPEYKGVYA
ncbi:MAG TPA: hypothetical protein PK239_13520 [Chitinophagales bacterium]|nr:hypothetical protein [Chitinophagales bacterium]